MCEIFRFEKLQVGYGLENMFMNERIILKWSLKQYDQGRRIFIRTEQEHVVDNFMNFLVTSNARRILIS
jgi:hypothetical protein